jgi:hypothetical protein
MFPTRRRRQQFERSGPIPVITSVTQFTYTVSGAGFGQKTGPAKLEVYEGESWSERATTLWNNTTIQHAAPLLPPGAKVRVTNAWGNVSNEFTVS